MNHLNKLKSDLGDMSLDAEYWDVRIEDSFETTIRMQNGEVITCNASPSLGAFVRLRKKGFWLYEATTEIGKIKDVLIKLDRMDTGFSGNLSYKAEKQEAFFLQIPKVERFSSVPLEQKLNLVESYNRIMSQLPKMSDYQTIYKDLFKTKSYLNSVGTEFEYDFNQGGWMSFYTLKDGGKLFEDDYRVFGSQFNELLDHESQLLTYLEESYKFLDAPVIEPGKYRVLLDPEVAGIFTHESFGHKSEADFMLGNPEALEQWKLGAKIGADCLTIVDCGSHTKTSGYCPIDDDGIPAQKNYLITKGVLTGRLHSRETAQQLNEKPTGNSRAINFEFEPIVRMTSTYIEPGHESLESILKRSEGAVFLSGARHGTGMSTFTISPTRAYRIGEGGAREPVRVNVISGSVFETLKQVEAVSSNFELRSSAIGGCGKMEQFPLPVADGGPYLLVKEMQVS